jgi:alpha-1,6-mannosyltransferase
MRPRTPLYLLTGFGAILLALAAAGLLLDIPATTGAARVARVNVLIGVLVVSAAVYFSAVRLVLRRAWPHGTLWLVFGVAVLLRVLMLTAPPILSSDIYRYVWDGRVQAAGINPYRYIPADPALAFLRDTVIYPQINRATYARTIYPPVAELVFAAVGRIWDSVMGMRLAMLGFEALGMVAMLILLPMAGMPRERILIYAWNPLALWSFANDGHVDAIAVGLLGLALLLRARHKNGWAGATLAAAVLTKFFPLLVAPAFMRGGRFWRPALAGLAVILGCYSIYIDVGQNVLGYLPTYSQREGLTTSGGIWLLAGLGKLIALPSNDTLIIYATATVAIFCVIIVAILRQPRPANDVQALCRDTALLATAATAAVSPHYHWYFAWLALPAVIAPSRALLWLATMPFLLIDEPIPGDRFFWPSLIYVPAVLLLLVDLRRRRSLKLQPTAENGVITCPLQLP